MTWPSLRPLRVLMTADAVGGVWTYAQALVRATRPADAAFTIAVAGPPPRPEQLEPLRRLPHVTVHARAFRLEWMPDGAGDLEASDAWLRELARETRPDIVHVNGYAPATAIADRPVLLAAHSCVRSWWRAVHRSPAPAEWDAYTARVRAALARADAVVAPSRTMAAALRREYGCTRPIDIVHNGLPPGERSPMPKQPFVLAAGRLWDEAKNLALVDAAADEGLAWPVFVAGALDGPDGGIRTPRHARALGPLAPAELARWLDRAAIFAHPARYEPFGLAPLEAARAGCALVLGNIRSLREIWGDAAMYVDPEDPASLRAALRRLTTDAGWRERLARAARVRAEYYTDRRMADAYLARYRALASQQPGAAPAELAAAAAGAGAGRREIAQAAGRARAGGA